VHDALILRGLRSGSEAALAAAVHKYTAYVCAIIRNAAGQSLSHEDIEETASDVFFALWKNARNAQNIKAYIAAAARNKALNKLRGKSAVQSLPFDDEIDAGEFFPGPEAGIIESEERQSVIEAVSSMDNPDREIFRKHYFEDAAVSDIAAQVGMSESAVKQRLARGRKKLMRNFNTEAWQ